MATVSAQEVGSSDAVIVGAIDVKEKHSRFMKSFEKREVKPLKFVELIDRICCHGRCDDLMSTQFVVDFRVTWHKASSRRKAVCKKFFCAVVALSEFTFNRFIVDYINGRHQAGAHGNTGPQESSTGNEYYAPPSLTKRECVEIATGRPFKRNSSHPYRLLKEISPRVHFRKTNDLTKCNICVELNTGLHNGRCVAHDGMTKMRTKLPYLLQDRAKLLADKDLAFCDLNVALVHRPSNIWGTNAVLSQLLDAVSRTKQTPPTVAFQLDNFGPNKSYLLLGALGWFLRVQSVVREFYIAYNEVGHTHIDIDACFGRFSKRLDRSQCPSLKQEFQKLSGVQRSTTLYTVYDFDKVVGSQVVQFGSIRKNHFFRVFVDKRGVPLCQFARFVRSEHWVKPSPTSHAILLFKKLPPVAPHPPVLPVDQEKIRKLDSLVEQCCTILSTRELSNILEAKLEYLSHVGEPFQQMLDRFKDNASVGEKESEESNGNHWNTARQRCEERRVGKFLKLSSLDTANDGSLPNSPQIVSSSSDSAAGGSGRKRRQRALLVSSPVLSLSDDLAAVGSGRKRKKTSALQVSPLIPSKNFGALVARKIDEEIELFRTASRNVVPPVVDRISIEKLHHLTLMSEVDNDHVEHIYHLCVSEQWNKSQTLFVVSQIEKDKYFVLDGNHRLAAFSRYNNQLRVEKKPVFMKQIMCRIYERLSLQQQLGVLKSETTTDVRLPFFLVDKVRVVRRYLEDRQIIYPMDQVEKQIVLLREIFPDAQPYIAKIAAMPVEHWNVVASMLQLFNKGLIKEKKSQAKIGVPESYSKAYKVDNHLDLHSCQFWTSFNTAYRKNQKKAMEIIGTLLDKDVKSVESELKDVCPDLISFLHKNGGLTFQSAVDVSNKLLGRVVSEKSLFDACTSRSYQPRLFERTSKTVAEEELKDKLLHELALADLTEVEISVSPNDRAVIDGLTTSSVVILDGKQDISCSLRSLSIADVEGCRLLVVLNSNLAESSAVANELFGGPSIRFHLRTSQAPLIGIFSV
uniref:DUF7869 domain-containing protein n=1 Tax=Ditylenchus dipsaci TaxID=166011 RepID=A0A915CX32_9BILA